MYFFFLFFSTLFYFYLLDCFWVSGTCYTQSTLCDSFVSSDLCEKSTNGAGGSTSFPIIFISSFLFFIFSFAWPFLFFLICFQTASGSPKRRGEVVTSGSRGAPVSPRAARARAPRMAWPMVVAQRVVKISHFVLFCVVLLLPLFYSILFSGCRVTVVF
jgi:hypothetical protein